MALTELDAKMSGVIVKITEEKTETLQKLARLNLTPGKRVEVEDKIVPSGSLTIRVEGESCTIDHDLASIIYVKKNEGEVNK